MPDQVEPITASAEAQRCADEQAEIGPEADIPLDLAGPVGVAASQSVRK